MKPSMLGVATWGAAMVVAAIAWAALRAWMDPANTLALIALLSFCK